MSTTRGLLLVLALLALSPESEVTAQSYLPRVEVAAGGGFAGTPGTEVVSRSAVNCNAENECVAVPGQVDLFADARRVWRPALATGIVLRWTGQSRTENEDAFGVGIGGQMVFTPSGEGTRLLPALSLHAGTGNTQLFFGLLFGSFDRVVFPNGAESIRVPAEDQPNFIRPREDNGPGFFVGVVIDGEPVTK
jgi:hypothetical protein